MGVVHGDIFPRNLLIDPATDNIQIFEFNFGAKLGWDGDSDHRNAFCYDPARNDVKFLIFTLYEIITRDFQFRKYYYPVEQDSSEVLEMESWEKHPEVSLDNEASKYKEVLEAWVKTREKTDKEITHYEQALKPIDWPCVPPFPPVFYMGDVKPSAVQSRVESREHGENFLEWQRPSGRYLRENPLPQGKRLLATGEIVDETERVSTTTRKRRRQSESVDITRGLLNKDDRNL